MRPESAAIRDPEVLALVGDDASLLAIVDAVQGTAPRSRRRRPLAFPVAALGAAGVALLLVAPWQASPSLVSRALAAVGEQPVVHVVTAQALPGISRLDLGTGRVTTGAIRTEVYFDAGRKLERALSSSPLEGADDELHTATGDWENGIPAWTCARIAAYPAAAARARVSCSASASTRPQPPSFDPALAAFATGYRSALASGKARHTGDGHVDGRAVHWLAIGSERVAVDARSLLPVLVRPASGRSYRVLSFETESFDRSDFALVPPPATPAAEGESVQGTRPVNIQQARSALGGTLVVPDVPGLRLQGGRLVNLLTGYGGKRRARRSVAVDLVYVRGSEQLVVQESRRPDRIAGFTGGPVVHGQALISWRGHLTLSTAEQRRSTDAGIPIAPWRGLLEVDGAYVSIDAWSKPLLLETARRLHRMDG